MASSWLWRPVRPSRVQIAALLLVASGPVLGRKWHNEKKHRHCHTYLQFCNDDTTVIPHGCKSCVTAQWPEPARLDPLDCKEAALAHSAVGTADAGCAGPGGSALDIYTPITIAMGLRTPRGDFKSGADVDTMTDWDRIRCKDGQLFATGCARPRHRQTSLRRARFLSA